MFSKKVTDGDDFMALSSSAQALYLHLTMSADDDGFCNQVSLSMFKAHASVQDLEALIEKRYIYQFESGVVVVTHWKMHNYIRKDRLIETQYKHEKSMLSTDENGAYFVATGLCQSDVSQMSVKCQSNVSQVTDVCQSNVSQMSDTCQSSDGQMSVTCPSNVSIGKDRIGKDRLGKDKKDIDAPTATKQDEPVCIERAKPKSRKKEELMTVYYPNDEVLNKAFADFVETRNQGKHPFRTNRAIELAINKLNKLSDGDNNLAIEIIEQSIIRGWESFYPIPSQKTTPANNASRGLYADLDEWLAKKEREEEEQRQNGI